MISTKSLKCKITPIIYYEKELQFKKGSAGKKWNLVNCPFHPDKSPSLSINMESGGYFCHACGEKGGDIIAFEMKLHSLSFPAALKKLEIQYLR